MSGAWHNYMVGFASACPGGCIDVSRCALVFLEKGTILAQGDKLGLTAPQVAVLKKAVTSEPQASVMIGNDKYMCLGKRDDFTLPLKFGKAGAIIYCGPKYLIVASPLPDRTVNEIMGYVMDKGKELQSN